MKLITRWSAASGRAFSIRAYSQAFGSPENASGGRVPPSILVILTFCVAALTGCTTPTAPATGAKPAPPKPDVIVASFHGIPREYADKGDPYPEHCAETARLMREKLGLDETKFLLTFQSRFGRAKWLEPYTDKTVRALAKSGVSNLVVITPGFSADCLETLEELAIRGRETFLAAGGTEFAYLPCLNDSVGGIAMLKTILARELEGWG